MSYKVGTYIDLRSGETGKENLQVVAATLFAVGTRLIFRMTPAGLTVARRITVVAG